MGGPNSSCSVTQQYYITAVCAPGARLKRLRRCDGCGWQPGGGIGGIRGSLEGRVGGGIQVRLGDFGGLLGGLGQRIVGAGRGGQRGLDQGDGAFRAGRGVLREVLDGFAQLLLAFGDLLFGQLDQLALHAGDDVVHVLAGQGLFGARLQQAGGERGGFLRILTSAACCDFWATSSRVALTTFRFSSTSFRSRRKRRPGRRRKY